MFSIAKHQHNKLLHKAPYSVGVWYCRVDQVGDDVLQGCKDLLDKKEISRLQRFKSAKKARSYAIAHGLLRQVLSLYDVSVQPKDWCFFLGEHGKPYTESQEKYYFNLTHCDDAVALVISADAEVGIDIETNNGSHDRVGIIKRYFHIAEQEHLLSLTEDEQRMAFYQYWTLKEAYSKGTSLGLANTLDHFSVNLSDPMTIKSSADGDWQFALCMPDNALVMAAAVNLPKDKIQWQIFEYAPFSEQFTQITDLALMRISA